MNNAPALQRIPIYVHKTKYSGHVASSVNNTAKLIFVHTSHSQYPPYSIRAYQLIPYAGSTQFPPQSLSTKYTVVAIGHQQHKHTKRLLKMASFADGVSQCILVKLYCEIRCYKRPVEVISKVMAWRQSEGQLVLEPMMI